ncbi:MAG: hypothetical protein ACK4NZ_10465, partial [Tsuneonella sp.]
LRERHEDWLIGPRLTPGAYPRTALGEALAATLEGVSATACASASLAALGTHTMMLFIDQLEELLTVCTDELDQEAFCALLAALGEQQVTFQRAATRFAQAHDLLASVPQD